MGFRPDARGGAVAVFDAEWALHAREVRRLHEKLFYRPLLEAVARVPSDRAAADPGAGGPPAGGARLRRPGRRPAAHRRADRRAVPAGGDPAHAAAGAAGRARRRAGPGRRAAGVPAVSDALGDTPWYLRLLRDEGQVAERLAQLLGTSRYVAELLSRAPEALRMLGDDAELRPRPADALRTSLPGRRRAARRPGRGGRRGPGLRRQELLRIASADLLGLLDAAEVGEALTDVAAATLEAALRRAPSVRSSWPAGRLPTRFAVIAMGRLGGAETGYGSDADVLFVHDPLPGADEQEATVAANAVIAELRRLLALPAPDPPLQVDAGLRPEGAAARWSARSRRTGRTTARWSSPWEAQALLRAAPLAGDAGARGRRSSSMIDPLRYPADGLTPAATTEIRRLKARMDAERLPRGADPATHTKLGRGGLADVEWTVQLLQLRHGAQVPGLRTTRTLPALRRGPERRPARRGRHRGAARRPGGSPPGSATRSCWCAAGRRTSCPGGARSWPG